MILNSGFDRAIDWTGEFNSFCRAVQSVRRALDNPPAQSAGRTVLARLVRRPTVPIKACPMASCSSTRNGLTRRPIRRIPRDTTSRSQSLAWCGRRMATGHDQHGGPTDPQAGNLPGVHRDVREVAVEPVMPPAAPSPMCERAHAACGPTAQARCCKHSTGATNGIRTSVRRSAGWGLGRAVDWSGDYLAARRRPAQAIAMDLPTFILVQSQLSGDGTRPAG